jgi:hypothetical protein
MADVQRNPRKALIVTLNNYRDPRNDLPSCNADGDLVERLVKEQPLGFEVQKLQDAQATIKGVEEKLDWLFDGAEEGDRLLFYYSGHGAREVRGDTLEDGLVLHDGFYAGDGLSAKSQEVAPGSLTVILDACFAGAADRLLIPTPDGFQIGKSKCWSPVDAKQIERHHAQLAATQALKLKPFGLAPTTSILALREARRVSMSADAVTQGAVSHGGIAQGGFAQGAVTPDAYGGAMREEGMVPRENGHREAGPREDPQRDDGGKAGKGPPRRVAAKGAETGAAEAAETRRGGEAGLAPSPSALGLNGLLVSACLEDETASASTPITKGLSAFTCCLNETLRREGFNRSTAEILANTGNLLHQLGFRQTPAIQEPSEPANAASSRSFVQLEPMPRVGGQQHLFSMRLAEAIRNSLQEQRAMGLLSAGIDHNAFWNDVGQIAGSVIPAVLQAMSSEGQSRDYWQMGGAKPTQLRQGLGGQGIGGQGFGAQGMGGQGFGGQGFGGHGFGGQGSEGQGSGGQGFGGQGFGGQGFGGQNPGNGSMPQHVAEIAAAVVPAVLQAVTREFQGPGGFPGQGLGGQGFGGQGYGGQGSAMNFQGLGQQGYGGSPWGGQHSGGWGSGFGQGYGGMGLGGDATHHHVARIVAAVVPAVLQTVSGGQQAMGPQTMGPSQFHGGPTWGGQPFGQGYGSQAAYGGWGTSGDAMPHHVGRLVAAILPSIVQTVSENYRQMGAGQMGGAQMGFGGSAGQQPGAGQSGPGGQPYPTSAVEQIVASVVPNVVTQLRQRNAA